MYVQDVLIHSECTYLDEVSNGISCRLAILYSEREICVKIGAFKAFILYNHSTFQGQNEIPTYFAVNRKGAMRFASYTVI